MKRLMSMFLALVMCLSLVAPAFAVEEEEIEKDVLLELAEVDEDNIPLEIMEKYYSLTQEEAEKSPTNLDAVAFAASEDATAVINQLAVQATETVGPFSAIYNMPVKYFNIMMDNLTSNPTKNFYPQSYNGKGCYLFSDGQTNVYVEAAAFCATSENGKVYPSDSDVSKTLTNYINKDSTSHVFSTHVTCVADGTQPFAFQWIISQIESFTFESGNDFRVVKSVISKTVTITVSSGGLTAYNVVQKTSYRPELALNITNGGTNNAYFNSFKFQMKGDTADKTKTNIAGLVRLGYNITKIYSSTFTYKTFGELIKSVLDLGEEPPKSGLYVSGTEPLSNPAEGIWTRQCSFRAPFAMDAKDDYYEMTIGIKDSNTDTKYEVNVTYYFHS